MKIDSVTIKTVQNRKRVRKSSAAQGIFSFDTAVNTTSSVQSIKPPPPSEAPRTIEPLTADRHASEQALKQSNALLDALEQIRLSFAGAGSLEENLEALRRMLKNERAHSLPTELKDILDMIELRAEVELAKIEAALATAKHHT